MEREAALTPLASAASPLAAIQAAQDGYARQIQSVSHDFSDERFGKEPKQVDHVDDAYASDGKTMRENLIVDDANVMV